MTHPVLSFTHSNVLAVLVKNDGNTPGGVVGRVAVEEPGSGPFCATVASYVPDTERLLEQVQAAAAWIGELLPTLSGVVG